MPNDTFSVGFNYEKFDETSEAKELSERLGVKNYLRHITADECFDAFPTIQYHMDEPQSNPSSVPLYFLSQLAAEHVTVVLSGEGADEIYAGYELSLIHIWDKKTNVLYCARDPFGIKPVSYTHLDVYKRQVYSLR